MPIIYWSNYTEYLLSQCSGKAFIDNTFVISTNDSNECLAMFYDYIEPAVSCTCSALIRVSMKHSQGSGCEARRQCYQFNKAEHSLHSTGIKHSTWTSVDIIWSSGIRNTEKDMTNASFDCFLLILCHSKANSPGFGEPCTTYNCTLEDQTAD